MKRDWKKEAEKINRVMLEHKRKLESDPEYRKQSEEIQKRLREGIPLLKYGNSEE